MKSNIQDHQEPAPAGSLIRAVKGYQPPTLRKGPVLTQVTANPTVSGAAFCWVARAAFGADDFRWMLFRAWLLEDAPSWFRSLYMRGGPSVGTWLAAKPRARALVRAMMMPAVRHKAKA